MRNIVCWLYLRVFFLDSRACGKNSRLAGFYGKKIYGRPGQQTNVGGIYSRLVPELQVCGGKRANRKNLAALSSRYNPVLMRVDLTDPNPYAEKLLEMLGSKSIPLTALFPQGPDSLKPLVLRDIYGSDSLFDSAKKAFGKNLASNCFLGVRFLGQISALA